MWRPCPEISAAEFRSFKRRFRKQARFLVDESLGVEAARVVRAHGYNCVFVGEVGLAGHDDSAVYGFAWQDDRILLTHDRDFLDRRRFPDHRNPGVIILPGGSGSTPGLELALARVLVILAPYREAHRFQRIHVSDGGEWSIHEPSGKRRVRFGANGAAEEWHE
jgi:predicted nuclease of predicted toxin-antitoxin system